MKIRNTKTISTALASGGLALMMSACSFHASPLKTADKKDAALFLVAASQYAEKANHVYHFPGGYSYGECMLGKERQSLCTKLYQSMAEYANKTEAFKGVTVSHLTDKVLFKQLNQTYQTVRFDTVDYIAKV